MSGKQKEGDNQRRRTLARRAREEGRQPSEAGVTLGASKQFERANQKRREGPPAAGGHKRSPETGGPPLNPPREEPSWPGWDPQAVGVPSAPGAPIAPTVRYQEFIGEVARQTRLDFDAARTATQATITTLARAAGEADRARLLDAVPTELHDERVVDVPLPGPDLADFLAEVADSAGRPPEQARYQAQAVLSALAERAPGLVESLELRPDISELMAPLPIGGGVVDVGGGTAPLTDGELRAALDSLPYWSGDRQALLRTIVLPRGNLERVLQRLDLLEQEMGRGPHIGRQDDMTAVIVVRTLSVDAVTSMDVDLAHRIDAAIDEAGAGVDTPSP